MIWQLSLIIVYVQSDFLEAHPALTLLESMVSFDLFLHVAKFSKKMIKDQRPIAHVVVT